MNIYGETRNINKIENTDYPLRNKWNKGVTQLAKDKSQGQSQV